MSGQIDASLPPSSPWAYPGLGRLAELAAPSDAFFWGQDRLEFLGRAVAVG